MARGQGDYATARAYAEESLALYRELGDREGVAIALNTLGQVAYAWRAYAVARAAYQESLALRRELGAKVGIAYCLEGVAGVARAEGHALRAARLLSAAEHLRDTIRASLPPSERADHEREVTAVRAALDEEAFAAAWAVGPALALEEAMACALEDAGDDD